MQRTRFKGQGQKMNILAAKHINQAHSLAWSFCRTTGIDFEELKSEALLALCIAVDNYDPSRGKLSTCVHHYVTRALCDFAQTHKENNVCEEYEEIAKSINTENTAIFRHLISNLGEEAKMVADIIFSGPAEIMRIAADTSYYSIKGKIKEFLASKGIKKIRIDEAFEELRNLF